MRKIICFILFLSLFSCGTDLSYNEQVQNYNFYIKKSDSLIAQKKYSESFGYINSAIEITDTIPIAIYLKGHVCYKLNYLDDAEEYFTKAIELEGAKSKTYKDRAKVYFKTGDSDFIDDIDIYISNYPKDEEALVLKRNYLEQEEDYAEAINEYNLAISKNKEDIALLTKRADLFFKNGEYEKCVQDYETILKLDPKNEKIKIKKEHLLLQIKSNSNRYIFIGLLIISYLIYALVSFFILKPFAIRKATNQIGGNFIVKKDPLIWFLPIFMVLLFTILYFVNFIPNFK